MKSFRVCSTAQAVLLDCDGLEAKKKTSFHVMLLPVTSRINRCLEKSGFFQWKIEIQYSVSSFLQRCDARLTRARSLKVGLEISNIVTYKPTNKAI